MTARIPLTEFQKTLPEKLPRHMRRRIVEGDGGCWICTGSKKHGRYQSVSINNKSVSAHRLSYELLVGQIPEGYEIDHLCKVTYCVNPSHLEAVPRSVNWERSNAISRINRDRTHCKNGHELFGVNLYIRPDGRGRQCRACQKHNEIASRARRSKKIEGEGA